MLQNYFYILIKFTNYCYKIFTTFYNDYIPIINHSEIKVTTNLNGGKNRVKKM